MGAALGITRSEHTSEELRVLSARCHDGAQVRRLLAVALVLDGHSRGDAAALNGMDRQTLRNWVHRYNAEGVDGLKSRTSPGACSGSHGGAASGTARTGDPRPGSSDAQGGPLAMRCLRAEVARRFSVDVHEDTIGRWLHELGLTRLQPRPVHPKKDAEAEGIFKKSSPAG